MLSKNHILFFLFVGVFLSLGIYACSKPDTEQGFGKVEIEQKIKGKWIVSGSDDIKSIEFLGGDTYMLELLGNSTLLNASVRKEKGQISFNKIEKLASLTIQPNAIPVSTTIISGTY